MKSAIIYNGPSMLDGAPIVAIAVWSNRNKKTGAMVQTYILRSDIDPRDASKTGADKSICGNCPMRGTPTDLSERKIAIGRKCYVNLGQGVLIVYKAFKRGLYVNGDAAAMGADQMVRLGTYGDPAAVPVSVWNKLTSRAKSWTGYTHQWQESDELQELCMASADSELDAIIAQSKGWRTFRVAQNKDIAANEINCPASKEAGAIVQCTACGLCKGASNKAKNIMILQH